MLKGFSKRRRTGAQSVALAFAIALAISAVIYVLLAFISAALAGSTDDPTGVIGIYALASLALSGALAGGINARMRGEGGFGFSLLVALTAALITMIISLIATGGISLAGLMNAVTYMGGGAVGAFVGKRRERRHGPRR